jgi:hypothetical protein
LVARRQQHPDAQAPAETDRRAGNGGHHGNPLIVSAGNRAPVNVIAGITTGPVAALPAKLISGIVSSVLAAPVKLIAGIVTAVPAKLIAGIVTAVPAKLIAGIVTAVPAKLIAGIVTEVPLKLMGGILTEDPLTEVPSKLMGGILTGDGFVAVSAYVIRGMVIFDAASEMLGNAAPQKDARTAEAIANARALRQAERRSTADIRPRGPGLLAQVARHGVAGLRGSRLR